MLRPPALSHRCVAPAREQTPGSECPGTTRPDAGAPGAEWIGEVAWSGCTRWWWPGPQKAPQKPLAGMVRGDRSPQRGCPGVILMILQSRCAFVIHVFISATSSESIGMLAKRLRCRKKGVRDARQSPDTRLPCPSPSGRPPTPGGFLQGPALSAVTGVVLRNKD